jgi:hypothetical protein
MFCLLGFVELSLLSILLKKVFNPFTPGGKYTSHHSKNLKSFKTFENMRGFENLGEIFSINVKTRRDPYKIALMIGHMKDIGNCNMSKDYCR